MYVDLSNLQSYLLGTAYGVDCYHSVFLSSIGQEDTSYLMPQANLQCRSSIMSSSYTNNHTNKSNISRNGTLFQYVICGYLDHNISC
jgi:hypothetical protein